MVFKTKTAQYLLLLTGLSVQAAFSASQPASQL